ncbi:MAG: hypothetical protein Q7R85_04285 [bacterium]|nr:hypothetical protein [bacterium]
MEAQELAMGDVVESGDLSNWEVLVRNLPREVARAYVFECATMARWSDARRRGPVVVDAKYICDWANNTAIVVHVPARDVKLALAVCRRGGKFQLLGRRGG